jgi:hypothetical protein
VKYRYGDAVKKNEISGAYSMNWEMINIYIMPVGKPQEKRLLEIHTAGCEIRSGIYVGETAPKCRLL